ncbi:MAG: class I SAM-dependent methyltransferase [Myxococcota bacterium]
MTVFGEYARYYDLLYREKAYAGEADWVLRRLREAKPDVCSVLDVGCGSGRHALELARQGVTVTGVDISPEMVQRAHEASRGVPGVRFVTGDARTVRLGERFDAVVALFHVLSYQTSNHDLLAFLQTIREHVQPDGVVLVDFWHAPAVLGEGVSPRIKEAEDHGTRVLRMARPVMRAQDSCVDVHYHLIAWQGAGSPTELREVHTMRFLLCTEVDLALRQVGLQARGFYTFGEDGPPRMDAFSAACVATASSVVDSSSG